MPLANDLRPKNLEEFIGQTHVVGPNGPIRKMIKNKQLTNIIFYGPPGTGKTTLAEILSKEFKLPFNLSYKRFFCNHNFTFFT